MLDSALTDFQFLLSFKKKGIDFEYHPIGRGKQICYQFQSLKELLEKVLYDETFLPEEFTPELRKQAYRTIEAVFFEGKLSPEENLRIFHCCTLSEGFDSNYEVIQKDDYIILDILNAALKKIDALYENPPALKIESFEAAVEVCKKYHITPPDEKYYQISNAKSVIMWLIDYIGHSSHSILRCQHCGHYFYAGRRNAKFCSVNCRVASYQEKLPQGLGDKLYHRICQKFHRRKKANRLYYYDVTQLEENQAIPEGVLSLLLATKVLPPDGDIIYQTFGAEDFAVMLKCFQRERKTRKRAIIEASKAMQTGEKSEKVYLQRLADYEQWHKDIDGMLHLMVPYDH